MLDKVMIANVVTVMMALETRARTTGTMIISVCGSVRIVRTQDTVYELSDTHNIWITSGLGENL